MCQKTILDDCIKLNRPLHRGNWGANTYFKYEVSSVEGEEESDLANEWIYD